MRFTPRGNYVQGQFVVVDDPNGEVLSRNPGDLDQPGVSYPFCFEHIHDSVVAARKAFVTWKHLAPKARGTVIKRYGDAIASHKDSLAKTIAWETGIPLWETCIEIDETVAGFDYFLKQYEAQLKEQTLKLDSGKSGLVRVMSRGVMAVVSPAIQPLYSTHMHMVPALLFGNTVVVKVSKSAPSVGQCLMEIAHEVGFPAGVLNFVQGNAEVARRLVTHTEVDGIFFTGSFETASKLKKQAVAEYPKTVVAHTGGKNATVVWKDCHFQKALQECFLASYLSCGQRSNSTERILVHESLFDRFASEFHRLAKSCRIGLPLAEGDKAPFLGPLVSEHSMENYLRFQGVAVREGCEEIMRGKTLDREKKGYYVSPSIHIVESPDPKGVYQTSEILGPNVALYKIRELEEAAEIINLPRFGLVASIYTAARENFLRISDEARVGVFHWNGMTTQNSPDIPYGGIKRSGDHRPMGSFAVYQCTYPLSSLEYPHDSPTEFPAPFGKPGV